MRQLSVSLLFLAATLSFAQTSSSSHTAQLSATITSANSNLACPVGFSASRQATGQIMSAGDAKQPVPTQALHLTLTNRNNPAIATIEVTVYGTAQKSLYLPVDSQSTDTVSKTFALHRISDHTTLSEADVRMNLTGTLDWADLISITYADGTSWHATTDLQCRAVASNLLLVGAKYPSNLSTPTKSPSRRDDESFAYSIVGSDPWHVRHRHIVTKSLCSSHSCIPSPRRHR